jgi:phosphatidylglycerophosphate synthase
MTDAWTRELLTDLRESRFRPRAWTRFLRRSFARAREGRREYPRAHLETLALGAVGLAAWAGGFERPGAATAGAAWWLAVVLMVDWHLGLLDHRERLGPANVLSILRAGTPPALLALGTAPLGVALFAVAGASDVLDGRLARRRGETTRLGHWLDASGDGLVLGAAALVVLPPWAAGLVIARYAIPWVLVAAAYFVYAEEPPRSGFVSGRYPGLVLYGGLSLGFLGLPGGTAVAVIGALAGFATFATTVTRSRESLREGTAS